MSRCGGSCVAFIWVSFLWPALVTIPYLILQNKINKKGKYFLINTILGYALFVAGNFIIMFLVRNFIDVEELMNSGANLEHVSSWVIGATVLFMYIPPIISSYFVAKKFS